MMPPISGMQAIAAATFEGNPVDVDFGPGSGPALGGGGAGCSSAMTYIHKMAAALFSNFATGQIRPQANLRRAASFSLSLPPRRQYDASLTSKNPWPKVPLPKFSTLS